MQCRNHKALNHKKSTQLFQLCIREVGHDPVSSGLLEHWSTATGCDGEAFHACCFGGLYTVTCIFAYENVARLNAKTFSGNTKNRRVRFPLRHIIARNNNLKTPLEVELLKRIFCPAAAGGTGQGNRQTGHFDLPKKLLEAADHG